MREIRILILCILVLALGIWLISPVMAESISMTADRNTIYFGDTVTLSGTNNETDNVYLFITGLNLPFNGGLLTDPRRAVNQYVVPLQFTTTDVNDDNSWEYKWQTANLNIDAGTYTIYAVTTPSDTDHLSETQYGTQSVVFIADNRVYPQMPDNTAEEDISTDGQPQIPKSDDKISITANRDIGYLGNEIKLSGTNFDTNETYLFITGPNLPANGGLLTNPSSPLYSFPNYYYPEFTTTDVNDDKTWEYKWQTANIGIDPSTYTIYAVTTPNDKNNLTNAHYSTVSVRVRKPYLTASISDNVIEQNESLYIRGTAEGDPSPGIAFWIFGENFVYLRYESVNDDGSFEYELDEFITASMSQGQYFVVVQHPMYNDHFDIGENGDYVVGSYPSHYSNIFKLYGPGSLPTSSALNALLFNLNNPNIDDRYVRLSFTIEEPSPPPLTDGYLSASIVSFGGEVTFQGNAKGNPAKGVAIWVIGDNSVNYQIIPVNPDSTYVYKMPTGYLTNGEYAVIVQHPMYNNDFDVYPSADKKFVLGPYPIAGSILFNLQELNSVSHELAIDAMVSNLENPNIDDIFIESKFSVGAGSSPFVEEDKLSVNILPSTINQGESIKISGNAKSNPSHGVAIWILGPNFISYNTASVNGDSFEYEMSGDITRNLSNGKYSVIVQHPMYNDDLDIYPRSDGGYGYNRYVVGPYPTTESVLFRLEGPGSLNSDSALNALLNALNNPNIDDQYDMVNFGVGSSIEPTPNPMIISLNPPSISTGSEGFTLEVTGTNFINSAKVFWDGNERTTEFISETKLTATILKEDVASEGTIKVKVVNPDGKLSPEVPFSITKETSIADPKVDTFSVNPLSGSVGQKFTISGNVTAGTGAVLQRVELWRNSGHPLNQEDWEEINPPDTSLQGLINGSYSFENSPDKPGEYWYGIHVVDSKTWAHEGGGQDRTDGEPIKVSVYGSSPSDSPKLVTDEASQISRTSAILKGHMENPLPGQTYNVCFRYEGGSTSKTKIGYSTVSASNPSYEYQLTDLKPGITYNYRAIHEDSEGPTNPHEIDAIDYKSFTTISAKIDPQIILNLNNFIPDENSQYFNKDWKVTPEQYKLMILASVWGEGGPLGFSAHSSDITTDLEKHPYAEFYFSTGIGPFQLDRGNADHWENWATIDKLNPELALKSTLKISKIKLDNLELNCMEDVRLGLRDTWFAYYKIDEHLHDDPYKKTNNGDYERNWRELTGTDWETVCNSNQDSEPLVDSYAQTWSNIITSISVPWNPTYFEVIDQLGPLHWDIRKSDGLVDWDGNAIEYDKDLDSWLIESYSNYYGKQSYLYGLDRESHIEIWAYYNTADIGNHLKSIFIRDYRYVPGDEEKYAFPIPADSKTITSHPIIKVNDPNYYRIFCPVDAELISPDGLLINKDQSEISNATYQRMDLNGDGDSDILITINEPKLGNYTLRIIPFSDANPDDVVTVSVVNGIYTNNSPLIIIDNIPISELPPTPFIYYNVPLELLSIPEPIFSYQVQSVLPYSYTFRDESIGNISSYLWSFGDGTFAENVTEVTHTYTTHGNYTVTLTVSGPDGEDSTSQVITIIPFLISPDGITNLHNSTYLPDSITWNWTDPVSSDFDYVMIYLNEVFQNNLTHGLESYTASGLSPSTSYTIGTRTVGTTGLINETWVNHTAMTAPDSDPGISPPEAQFNANSTSGNAPLTIQFNDTSTGDITSYEWDFGDGANSTEKNPVHTYTSYGMYNVSFTVTNTAGEDTIIKNNFIQVNPMVGGDTGYYLIHCNVDGAGVYFDEDYKGVITDGTLLVKIYLTATPYHRYSVSKVGYVTVNEALLVYPAKDQTKDIFVTLVKVTDNSWTRPPYPEVTRMQPGYPDTNWTRPPYPEVTRLQPGYPDTNWTRPPYPEVTRLQPGYPDTNWTRPSYLDWIWNRSSIQNFFKDMFSFQ